MTEQHRLRVFENSVLRVIYGAKRGKETGEWSKLHSKGPHTACTDRSSNVVRMRRSEEKNVSGECSTNRCGKIFVCVCVCVKLRSETARE